MARIKSKRKFQSMYVQLVGLLLAAILISGAFYLLINRIGARIITEIFMNREHIEQISSAYVDDLQKFIDENQVSSNDSDKLTAWVKRQKIISIQVYKNELLTYNSYYPEAAVEDVAVEGRYYEWEHYYTVEFSDGTADVFLYGFFAYQLYTYALIAEILLAVVLLILIVIFGIRRTVRYIGKLKEECDILGSGDLDYEITVRGRNELSLLAEGMNHMRIALKESSENEEELSLANRRIITEMSHDLRTPLTSLLIYTGLLRKKEISDPDLLQEYLWKIDKKAQQIKRLSDNIFEYALMAEGAEVKLGEPETFREVFYDPLSEMAAYLEERQYITETNLEKDNRKICVNEEYINRILDNIVSNIIKYADKKAPIKIYTNHTEEWGRLVFRNTVCADPEDKKRKEGSTSIGLHNVDKMMKDMDGACVVEKKQKQFEMVLQLPWKAGVDED